MLWLVQLKITSNLAARLHVFRKLLNIYRKLQVLSNPVCKSSFFFFLTEIHFFFGKHTVCVYRTVENGRVGGRGTGEACAPLFCF